MYYMKSGSEVKMESGKITCAKCDTVVIWIGKIVCPKCAADKIEKDLSEVIK